MQIIFARRNVSTSSDTSHEVNQAINGAEKRWRWWGKPPLAPMYNADYWIISTDVILVNFSVLFGFWSSHGCSEPLAAGAGLNLDNASFVAGGCFVDWITFNPVSYASVTDVLLRTQKPNWAGHGQMQPLLLKNDSIKLDLDRALRPALFFLTIFLFFYWSCRGRN